MSRAGVDSSAARDAMKSCACFHFRKASRAVTQFYDATLQPTGLRSTQFVILVAIKADTEPSLPDLAEAMNLDRSTLTRNLKPLERDGLVRVFPRRHERALHVKLTAKGERLVARTMPAWEDAQERFVAQLGSRRWRTLLSQLGGAVTAAQDA